MSTATVTTEPGRPSTASACLDDGTATFGGLKSRLLGIAYRILGSRSEAEDIVQDAWLRWQLYDRTTVADPTAFLVTTTTRLAINAAQSARVRREAYVGHRLPEPVASAGDPALGAEHREDVELGILVLLERLAPTAGPPTCSTKRSTTRTPRSRRPADHRSQRASARQSCPQTRRRRSATFGEQW